MALIQSLRLCANLEYKVVKEYGVDIRQRQPSKQGNRQEAITFRHLSTERRRGQQDGAYHWLPGRLLGALRRTSSASSSGEVSEWCLRARVGAGTPGICKSCIAFPADIGG